MLGTVDSATNELVPIPEKWVLTQRGWSESWTRTEGWAELSLGGGSRWDQDLCETCRDETNMKPGRQYDQVISPKWLGMGEKPDIRVTTEEAEEVGINLEEFFYLEKQFYFFNMERV